MDTPRRYSDEEVARILDAATETRSGTVPVSQGSPTGLTLEELKEIGAEVGIDPTRIQEAAAVLSVRPPEGSTSSFLGTPRRVSRTVPLPRPLDEGEWNRLVADARETFGAAGRVTGTGDLRSWTNGNLQVHMEPDRTGGGYQIRMRTLKGDLIPRVLVGSFFSLFGVLMVISSLLGSAADAADPTGWILALAGLVIFGHTRWMLGGWAEERTAQMETLARRIPQLLEDSHQTN